VIASTNGSLGRYDQGFAASDRELALLREHGGSDLEMARALIVRGELYRAHGLYAEAQAPLRHALSLLSGLSDVEADRGKALDELGMALVNTRNEREAEGSCGRRSHWRSVSIPIRRSPPSRCRTSACFCRTKHATRRPRS